MAILSRAQGYALFAGTKRSAGKGKPTAAKNRRKSVSEFLKRSRSGPNPGPF